MDCIVMVVELSNIENIDRRKGSFLCLGVALCLCSEQIQSPTILQASYKCLSTTK
jgi:hypothetical protein